jgi:deoxyhypusine synthase
MHKKGKEVTDHPVEQLDIKANHDIVSLINSWDNMGFNAKRLARAAKIYEKMLKDTDCVKFFALSGAMVPAGMQKIIYDFIDEGFIDVLVTTGANITHDLAEALGDHHLQGFSSENTEIDATLHENQLNRIYDVLMPNQIYENMENWIKTFELDPKCSVKEAIWALGEHLPAGNQSILRICYEKQIPIYCPAFTDSGLGMQLMFRYPGLNLNHFEDLNEMINTAWDTKVPGVFILGGGVPKNFIFQAMQFSPNSAKYVVQVTTDAQVSAGGLSSASLSEAISWGKINPEGQSSQVHVDATIAMPIILSYLKQRKLDGIF